ncbi:PelD GGDEF domain-containing protein [Sulfurihydrogenibium azorense]|uniref:PelD GGDEF domain-containing protein n=1 Tax=Sulfurihydrogenibium azorense TaxID=309806 RepID=UPI00391920BE
MFLTKFFSGLNLKILLAEIILFFVVLIGIGAYTNPNDPLFINSQYGYLFYLLPILVLTLYYGLTAGVVTLTLIFIVMMFYYKEFNLNYFLWIFLFTLVASEFNHYWTQNLKKAEEKFKYADDKLRDLARELMLLKISHDQLERQYIIKPISIRSGILDLREKMLTSNSEKEPLEFLLKLVSTTQNIYEAAIVTYSVENNNFEIIVSINENFKINPDDILIKKSIEDDAITYISQIEEYSEYLAVIPVKEENLYYLFIIKDMNFLSLNLDTLLMINLFMFYILKEEDILKNIKEIVLSFKEFNVDFIKEVYRMYQMYRNLNVESTIVTFYVRTDDYNFPLFIKTKLRGLDVMDILKIDKGVFILPILLPFTPFSGAQSFVRRMTEIIKEFYSEKFLEENIKYKIELVDKDIKHILIEIYTNYFDKIKNSESKTK